MSIDISKVTTKGGDQGMTSLSCGTRVSKSHPRVIFMGKLDSLNCLVGSLRTQLELLDAEVQTELKHPEIFIRIQNDLFDLGAFYSFEQASEYQSSFGLDRVTHLEEAMSSWIDELPPLKSFVLPGGHPTNALAHQIRSQCREIESWAVSHLEELQLQETGIAYLNRLSDFFFVYSRACSMKLGVSEYLWQSGLNS